MKKLAFYTIFMLLSLSIFADNRRNSKEITTNDLPKTSQDLITKYFKNLSSVTSTWEWPNNYSAYLSTGQKIEFFLDGSLKEADSKQNALPKEMINELPQSAINYINSKYSTWDLIEIEFKRSKIEVKFEKGRLSAELEFSRSGELVDEDIDD